MKSGSHKARSKESSRGRSEPDLEPSDYHLILFMSYVAWCKIGFKKSFCKSIVPITGSIPGQINILPFFGKTPRLKTTKVPIVYIYIYIIIIGISSD